MRSMPIPLKVTDITTPPKNNTIGTKSSIGIAYSFRYMIIYIKAKVKDCSPFFSSKLGASLAECGFSCNFLNAG